MRPRAMTALLPLCLLAPLQGCANPQTRLVERKPATTPLSFLQCPDKPNPPGPDGTQKSVALYIVDINEAYDDCKARMSALYEVVRPK